MDSSGSPTWCTAALLQPNEGNLGRRHGFWYACSMSKDGAGPRAAQITPQPFALTTLSRYGLLKATVFPCSDMSRRTINFRSMTLQGKACHWTVRQTGTIFLLLGQIVSWQVWCGFLASSMTVNRWDRPQMLSAGCQITFVSCKQSEGEVETC